MFTIEHEFDATIITLLDEGPAPLAEDVVIRVDERGAAVSQAGGDAPGHVQLSPRQLHELAAALDLPEGSYRLPGRR